MRRTFLVALSLAVFLLMATCSHVTSYDQAKVTNPCGGGGNPPVVCIDPVTLVPAPDPIHVHRGQWVHFFFITGSDDLAIDCGVLEDKNHGKGHAWGRVRKDAPEGPAKYTIRNLRTGRENDPTMIIDP